jgi:hypothetical protein
MLQKWKTPKTLRVWLDMPENAERKEKAIVNNIKVREARKEEYETCECCYKEYTSEAIAGCCSKCSIENMCCRCGYFNEVESEWYCETCRDKSVESGEWLESSDDEDAEN